MNEQYRARIRALIQVLENIKGGIDDLNAAERISWPNGSRAQTHMTSARNLIKSAITNLNAAAFPRGDR